MPGGNFALAGVAGGAVYGALYGAGNTIIDGVNNGQSAREIARSATGAFVRGGATGFVTGGALGIVKMGLGAVVGKSFFLGPLKGAGVFTGIQTVLGAWEGLDQRFGIIDRILDTINEQRNSFNEHTVCPD